MAEPTKPAEKREIDYTHAFPKHQPPQPTRRPRVFSPAEERLIALFARIALRRASIAGEDA